MTVHRVIVQIRRPSEFDRGQVTEGFYVIEGDTLMMTAPDGGPIMGSDGLPVDPDQFRHVLKPGDEPGAIAGMLTKKVRRHILGISETQESFGRSLIYEKSGIA